MLFRSLTSIVRALIHDPDLLVMDEPFSALSYVTKRQIIWSLDRMWLTAARAIFLVTHVVEDAVHLADQVLVFRSIGDRGLVLDLGLPRPRPADFDGGTLFEHRCREVRKAMATGGPA